MAMALVEAQSERRGSAEAQLLRAIDARSAVVVVVGLGYIGTSAMEALFEAGFECHGYDRSLAAVERFRTGVAKLDRAPGRAWSASDDAEILATADVVLIAVRALVQGNGSVNLEPLQGVAADLRRHAKPECLVLIESTLPPGTTRRFAEEWLGLDADSGMFVAHCPERLQVGNARWTLRNTPHLVGGIDAAATRLAQRFFSTLCSEVVPCTAPEVCELSKLLENVFMAVGISFIGEVSRISHALGISAEEVARAAATKPFGYFPFYPGPGIGGHCIPNDLQILRRAIRDLGLNTPLLDGTAASTADLPRVVVDYLADLLGEKGKALAGLPVLLIGVGFKIGSPDTTDTPARDVVRYLRRLDALPMYVDSGVPSFAVDGEPVARVGAEGLAAGGFEAGIVLSGDAAVSGELLSRAIGLLLDAGGGRIVPGGLPGAVRL